jgi:hypothetical protein
MNSRIVRGKESKPPRILLYGTEGIGKTTFAAGAPKPIFIPTEDGLGELEVDRFPLCEDFESVLGHLTWLIDGAHDYETVVIDSLDWLERLIHDHVCMQNNVDTIERVDGGYGRGYLAALAQWRKVLSFLQKLRDDRSMIVLLIAHAKIERFEDPETLAYDRYMPRLHRSSAALVTEWCDAVFFAHWRFALRVEQGTFGKSRNIPMSGPNADRVMRVSGGPTCVAKNRYGLTGELPLDWNAFARAVVKEG